MEDILSRNEIELLPELPAERVTLKKGKVLTEQYVKSDRFFFLLEGRVDHYLFLEEEQRLFKIGESSERFTPVGWSGFNFPFRYSTTVKVSSASATFLTWKIKELLSYFQTDFEIGIRFLKFTGSRARRLMYHTLKTNSNIPGFDTSKLNHTKNSTHHFERTTTDISVEIENLRRSPFFESFKDETLMRLSEKMERKSIRAGENLYEQGSISDGVYILEQGWFDFFFRDEITHKEILFRSISTTGFIVGWSSVFEQANIVSVRARRESVVYYISLQEINKIIQENTEFGFAFYQRMLWLISHQLQVVRIRYLYLKFNMENLVVKSLIDLNCTRLSLHSPLHKIPHLLASKLTQEEAFRILHGLHETGDSQERHIASLCLDNLQEIQKEQLFYSGLLKTYNIVVSSPADQTPCDIRKVCAETFEDAFTNASYEVEGWDNLPDESGHIFIYNHLRNHPYNTLPNNFQVTLDSHFISSLILHKKYNDPGIRVVRIGRGIEYGHQEYYERLGHIDVFTPESDPAFDDSTQKEEKRHDFYKKAGELLKRGQNLIISPEGTSYATEESPGPFKSGAFRLALAVNPEPLIIPLVMIGFDKRVRQNKFKCIINKPLKISSAVEDPSDKEGMQKYLKELQQEYKLAVKKSVSGSLQYV